MLPKAPQRSSEVGFPILKWCGLTVLELLMVKRFGKVECAILDHSPHFKKPLQVVYLSEGHGYENERLKEGPQHHPAVSVVVDWKKKNGGGGGLRNEESLFTLDNFTTFCIKTKHSTQTKPHFTNHPWHWICGPVERHIQDFYLKLYCNYTSHINTELLCLLFLGLTLLCGKGSGFSGGIVAASKLQQWWKQKSTRTYTPVEPEVSTSCYTVIFLWVTLLSQTWAASKIAVTLLG